MTANAAAVPIADWKPRPLERVLQAFRASGCRFQILPGDRARVTCPSHPDARASLSVTMKNGRVLMRCFAGCRTSDVLAAVGLRFADLFDLNTPRIRPVIAATYAYADRHGDIIAEKIRFEPKGFRWRRPDGTWGLNGASLPLYRLPDLIDATDVLLTEGERGVEQLWARGFVATCGPAGASTWQPRWTADLMDAGCERLTILPDHDKAGAAHAHRVALECFDSMQVKVINLPGLPSKGDVVDFFDAGHTASELRLLVDNTPVWTPEARQRERQQKKRDQARLRKHRQRERRKTALGDGHAVYVTGSAGKSHAANVNGEP